MEQRLVPTQHYLSVTKGDTTHAAPPLMPKMCMLSFQSRRSLPIPTLYFKEISSHHIPLGLSLSLAGIPDTLLQWDFFIPNLETLFLLFSLFPPIVPQETVFP